MIKNVLYKNTNHGFVILISCVATIGGFLFGFDSGVINGTVDGLRSAFNYGIYAVFAAVSAVFVHKMVHETRGLELEEMRGR